MSLSNTLWYADSGATQHMSDQRQKFKNFQPISPGSRAIHGIGNKVLYAHGVGDVPIYAIINGSKHTGTIKNVLFVPDIGVSLLSIPTITELGFEVYFQQRDIRITRGGEIFMTGRRLGETLYQLDITSQEKIADETNNEAKVASTNAITFAIWHERFAHVNYATMQRMIKLNVVTGLNVVGSTSHKEDCTACIIGKMSRLPFPKGRTRAGQVGGIVHSDLVGPFQVATPNGKLYYVIFKDDYSGYKVAYFMKNKSETEECFKEYMEKMFTETRQCPRILRSDNGGEYTSNSFRKWLSTKGIIHQTSAANTPQQNGVSERDNRTTVEGARTELHAKNTPLYL